MTDTQMKLGKIIFGEAYRDAVHIAVMPAIAGEDLYRGDEVGLVYGTSNQIKCKESVYGLKPIGIVDPFLGLPDSMSDRSRGEVKKGQRCYVFLFPGTITNMRHYWSHSEIDKTSESTPKITESEKWLRQFADKWNFDYDDMIAGAQDKAGGWITARGIDLHSAEELAPGDEHLFWHHIELMTGQSFNNEHKQRFGWSCTC